MKRKGTFFTYHHLLFLSHLMMGSGDAPRWRDQTYTVPLGRGVWQAWVAGWQLSAQPSCFLLCLSCCVWGSRAPAELLLVGWQHAGDPRVMQQLSSSHFLAEPSSSVCSGDLVYPSCANMQTESSHSYRKGLTCFPEGLMGLGALPSTGSWYWWQSDPSLLVWVCSRAKEVSLSPYANPQPQKDVSTVLWHRDKMKSKDSSFMSGSSFPC